MQPLIDAGSYEILTPPENLKNMLINIEKAGRTCYQSQDKITETSAIAHVKMLIKRGHEAMVEHSHLSVVFNNVSRGFTHEMVRHRPVSFGQESTRFVDPKDLPFVFPPHIDIDAKHEVDEGCGMELSMREMAEMLESFYRALIDSGMKKQDARQILPIGTKSQIVVSTNIREWRHIFSLRCDRPAHWEIRRVMCNLLEELQSLIPVVFDDFIAGGFDDNGLPYYKLVRG